VIIVKISMALFACVTSYLALSPFSLSTPARSEDKSLYCISISNDFILKAGGVIEDTTKVRIGTVNCNNNYFKIELKSIFNYMHYKHYKYS